MKSKLSKKGLEMSAFGWLLLAIAALVIIIAIAWMAGKGSGGIIDAFKGIG